MLKDNFDRTISYVRISVTDRCNLRCRYCVGQNLPFIPHDEILRHEEIIRFVRICAGLGIRKVRLTGGEPLMRKGILYLLKELRGIKGIEDISLTTNGIFLGRVILDLKEAGLERVNISLDTLKRDRFSYITRVDAFDEVLMSIEKCLYSGINPIKINTVIIRGFNDDEVVDFARIARKWDIQVRFIEFMPFGDDSLWNGDSTVPSEEIKKLIEKHHPLIETTNTDHGPAKMFRFTDGSGQVGFISPLSSHICSQCNRIRLTSTGMIRPCLFSDTEFDIKGLLRGNSNDEDIANRIGEIVREKPEKRLEIGYIKKCQRCMRTIGG